MPHADDDHPPAQHEWAMLYTTNEEAAPPHRHQALPLRLSQAQINEVVESMPIHCTHFDAFRFFTPEAAPLNTVLPTPTRASQPALEQPGCVHASMDLFRYCLKLWPWVPSELMAETGQAPCPCSEIDGRSARKRVLSGSARWAAQASLASLTVSRVRTCSSVTVNRLWGSGSSNPSSRRAEFSGVFSWTPARVAEASVFEVPGGSIGQPGTAASLLAELIRNNTLEIVAEA